MKFTVAGTHKSGQNQMRNMLRNAGYDVGFNGTGKDGTILDLPWSSFDQHCCNGPVYHLLCDPRFAVATLRADVIKNHCLQCAQNIWFDTNIYIGTLPNVTRLRIEFIRQDWPTPLYKPKKFSRWSSPIEPLTWKHLSSRTKKLAMEYGYGVCIDGK